MIKIKMVHKNNAIEIIMTEWVKVDLLNESISYYDKFHSRFEISYIKFSNLKELFVDDEKILN